MKTIRHSSPFSLFIAFLFLAGGLGLFSAGCGRKPGSDPPKEPPANPPAGTPAAAATPAETMLVTWQKGNQTEAVQQFMAADWKQGPAFSATSSLSRRESDLPSLPVAEREILVKDVLDQLKDVRGLANAVMNQGKAAVATNPELARRCFAQVDQFGAALDQPDAMKIVQLVGKACRKMAAAETTQLGK